MAIQYTLSPVRLIRRAGPFLSGACVIIQDITDHKGKRKSPRRCVQESDRILVSDRDGIIRAWTDASNLEEIANLTDLTPGRNIV